LTKREKERGEQIQKRDRRKKEKERQGNVKQEK
jgi:hypothetical protein